VFNDVTKAAYQEILTESLKKLKINKKKHFEKYK
jgi:hypothetical protein